MKVQNINSNNYQKNKHFGAISVYTKLRPVEYSEMLKKHSLVDFVLNNPHIDSRQKANIQQVEYDVFMNSKELKKAEALNRKIKPNSSNFVLSVNGLTDFLFTDIWVNAKKYKQKLSTEEIETLIKADV